ncbi:MAG: dTDP-4-dehydrorhamnose 3,5-epimerase [Hyphomonadaceae bacterium]
MSGGVKVEHLGLDGVLRITPRVFEDARGSFSETYSQRSLRDAIGDMVFVQDNVSRSVKRGAVRGLHYQDPPFAQAKLVRVLRGSIFDVAVDIRRGSPTYGRHVALTLTAASGAQIFVPHGFAHGFCTLEDDTEVFYKVDALYSPEHDRAIHWADPALGIDWPIEPSAGILSPKDAAAPRFADIASPFAYKAAQ